MAFVDPALAERFFALSVEERLTHIIETTSPIWLGHLNDGVSLVYDNTCVMVHDVTAKILGVEKRLAQSDFEIFGSRQALRMEMASDHFLPDAGGFSRDAGQASAGKLPYLFMMQSAIKGMTSDDFRFDPACLLPKEDGGRTELMNTYAHVFSAQFRFWPQDLPDYQARYDALIEGLALVPDARLIEKTFEAELRTKNRFKKKKEAQEFAATKITAIAIGLDLK